MKDQQDVADTTEEIKRECIGNLLLHMHVKTYIHQFCADTECRLKDQPALLLDFLSPSLETQFYKHDLMIYTQIHQRPGRSGFNLRSSHAKDSKNNTFGHFFKSLVWFALGLNPGLLGSNAPLLNTQHYKVWIKGKVEQSREMSSAFPYTSV